MTTVKQNLLKRSISFLLVMLIMLSMCVTQAFAAEPEVNGGLENSAAESAKLKTLPKMENGAEYYVNVDMTDAAYELPGYVYSNGVICVDSKGKLTLKIKLLEDYSKVKVSSLTVHKTIGSNDPKDLKNLPITEMSGKVGWKQVSGEVWIPIFSKQANDVYTGTFKLSNNVSGNYTLSISWESLKKKLPSASSPVISPKSGAIHEKTKVSIKCDTKDAVIYYTTDGTDPTDKSKRYDPKNPILVNKTTAVKAVAIKKDMEPSSVASAFYRWNLLGDINRAELTEGKEYNTLRLYTKDKRYTAAADEEYMSVTKYFIHAKQGKTNEKFIYNGGIGGFAIQYNPETKDRIIILNLDKSKWDVHSKLELDIVMFGYQNKHLEFNFNNSKNNISVQKDTEATALAGKQISKNDLQKGKTYTASFHAYRIDDGKTESMLAGFFDKNVKLQVDSKGNVTASFYNLVFAHSMLDFAIQGSDGQWKSAAINGKRTTEKNLAGEVKAAVYTLPVPSLSSGKMVGAVNVQAMGGSVAMNGFYDKYTQVKLVFDDDVTEGFNGFAVNNTGMTNSKMINRGLMTVSGMDLNKDGYVSDEEMKNYKFSGYEKSLDLSYSAMLRYYSPFDQIALEDISWLEKLGDKSLERISLNGCRITEIKDEFKGFSKLKKLELSANCISKIDDNAFDDLHELNSLHLSSNLLTSVNDKVFSKLTKVGSGDDSIFDLSNNRISSIEPKAFENMGCITGLYLSGNQITSISADVFPTRKSFTWLSLAENQLVSVPKNLQKLEGLQRLYLSKNNISEIGDRLDNLSAITEIYLSRNLIESIPESTIASNPSLEKFETDKNSITVLPTSLLEKIAKGKGRFSSVFEFNSIDMSKCNLSKFNGKEKKALMEAADEYPSKNDMGITLKAEDGKLSYNSELSGFDYYLWTFCKGRALSEAKESAKKILGKNSIDTAKELKIFKASNVPNFSDEVVLKSILTDSTGTIDTFKIKTDLQELRNGSWFTLKTETVQQKEDAKQDCVKNKNISPNGRYRLLKTVNGGKGEYRIAVYAGSGDGTEVNQQRKLKDGVYSIHAEMIKTDRTHFSMANNAINHTVKLEVIGGEYYVTLNFKGMAIENKFGYLSKLEFYDEGYVYGDYGKISGDLIPAEVLSTQKDENGKDVIDKFNSKENLYPNLVKIKLAPTAVSDREGFVPLRVFVPIMESIASGTGTQNVFMKLNWKTLKKTTADDSAFLGKKEKQSNAFEATDSKTGIHVKAEKGVFEDGVKLNVKEITSGNEYSKASSALKEIGKKFKLYDVYFTNENGNTVQPNGKVTVNYPIPKGYNADKVELYRINKDGSKTLISGTVQKGRYTVVTKSFSTYALVEKGSIITDSQNSSNVGVRSANTPKTGDYKNAAMAATLMTLISAGLIIFIKIKNIRASKDI